ncbi:hypothetical protein CRM22_010654 [Opisthorchis felineus]|uniref:Uncharacterized protein n=1 Tax=Opisthorchis felineus TaxID=147828 RepID=A0A4S2KR33_OPIFE|nr:hypothetical protein CRM22_010654 [Opisthorchis felineus]
MSDDTSSSGSDQAYSDSETDSSSSLGTDEETYTQSSESKEEKPDTDGRQIESHVNVRSTERETPIEIRIPRLSQAHEESSSDESEPPSLPTPPLSTSHSTLSKNVSTEKIIDENRESDTQEDDDEKEIETKAEEELERENAEDEDDDEPHSASYLSVPYTEDRAGTDSESEDERHEKKKRTGMKETMSLRCHSCMNRFRDTCATVWNDLKKQTDKYRPKEVAERPEKKQEPSTTESVASRREPITIQPTQALEPTPTEEEVFGHTQPERSRRTSSESAYKAWKRLTDLCESPSTTYDLSSSHAGAPAKLRLSSHGQSLRDDLPADEEIKGEADVEEDDEACSASYLSVPYTEDRFPTGDDSDEEDKAKGRTARSTGENPVLLLCHSCMDRTRTACQSMWTKCQTRSSKSRTMKKPKPAQPTTTELTASTAQPVTNEPLPTNAPVVEEVMPPATKSALQAIDKKDENEADQEEDDDDDEPHSASYLSVPYTEDRHSLGDDDEIAKPRNSISAACHSCVDRVWTYMRGLCNPSKEDRK